MSVKVQCVRCKKEFPTHEISETPLNAPLCEIIESCGRLTLVYFEEAHPNLHSGNGICEDNHCYAVDIEDLIPAGGAA